MHRFLIPIILTMFCISIAKSEIYRFVEVDSIHFDKLSEFGVEINEIVKNGNKLKFAVDETQYNLLENNDISCTVLINDFSSYLAERLSSSLSHKYDKIQSYILSYGSMGGYFTLEELYNEYDALVSSNPEHSKKELIGKSYEGRDIWAYHFGELDTNSIVPSVLFTSLHHAREPAGASALLYFIKHLLTNLSHQDKQSEYLINNRKITIVPAVNPDGYEYNRLTNPSGGGLWRKNRRMINDSTYGVDLNRNYGPNEFWDSNAGGSSSNPKLATYRGEFAFSEPETQAIRDLCEKEKYVIAVNYHTFGNMLIYPWGVLAVDTPDSLFFRKFSFYSTAINKYIYGLDMQTLNYVTQGNADDWMYLENSNKGKIYSFTPEVGNSKDYFWPPFERIYDLCLENLKANYEFLWSAGYNYRVLNYITENIDESTSSLNLEISNIGIAFPPKTNFLKITSLNKMIEVVDNHRIISALKSGQSEVVKFELKYKSGFENGSFVGFVAETYQNGIVRSDTFFLKLIKPVREILFSGEDANWISDNWGLEFDKNINQNIFNDNPNAKSIHNRDNYLYYKNNIDLTGFNSAQLVFISKWFIEQNYDAATVEISTNSGDTWLNMASERMIIGLGISKTKQQAGKSYLEGNNFDYVPQYINLDQFCGKSISLRFGVLTDNATAYPGWYIKDVFVDKYDETVSVAEFLPENRSEANVFVRKGQEISLNLKQFNSGSFVLCNLEGRSVSSGTFDGGILNVKTYGIPSGSYFLLVEKDGNFHHINCLIAD